MKRLGLMMVAGVLAVGATACFDDPVADLRGGADRIQFSTNYIVMNVGDTQRVDVKLYDAVGGSLPFAAPTFASTDANVANADLFPDPAIVVLPNSDLWKTVVVGTGPGSATITYTAGGVTGDVTVLVFPVTFGGAITPASVAEGAEVTIASTSNVGFRTNSVVTVDGLAVFATGNSATQLKFIATPVGAGQTVNITNLLLLGQYNIAALDAATALTVTNANEPGNDAGATAQVFTPPANVGDSVILYGSISDDDVDDYLKFTTGAAGNYQIRVFWPNSTADIDVFALNGTGGGFCALDACSMATGADPETATVTLAAATAYQILVELYDTHGIAMPHPYRVILKRIT